MSKRKKARRPNPNRAEQAKLKVDEILAKGKHADIYKITPEIAAEMFSRNAKIQRPHQQRTSTKYGKLMEDDRWKFNGDAIRFITTGEMVDGQHRCKAIMDKKETQECVVVTGIELDAYHTIDRQARCRKMSDTLHSAGHKDGTGLAAAANLLWRYTDPRWPNNYGDRVSDDTELLELIDDNPLLPESLRHGRKCSYLLPKSLTSCTHYLLAEIDRDTADAFFEQLATGVGLGLRDPLRYFREEVQKQKKNSQAGQRANIIALMANLIIAWNYRRTGKHRRPRWDGQQFPKPL